jgi:DNA-directed RNA polymerase subunit RPC12/RpoP
MSPRRYEYRYANLRCLNCDHQFREQAWQFGHDVEEGNPQDIQWKVDRIEGVTCPHCGSDRLEQAE